MRLQHFYENGRFVDKMGVGELCVLENGSFLTIYGHGMGALIFS